MRLIIPQTSELDIGTAGTGGYVYPTWDVAAEPYDKNDVVRYRTSSVAPVTPYYDYRCLLDHTSAALYVPTNDVYWELIGLSATVVPPVFETNVITSLYRTWATGVDVPIGAKRYDPYNHHDYVAPNAITAVNNVVTPSLSVVSDDPATAARWVDLGAANAWAPFDKYLHTIMQGVESVGVNATSITFIFETVIKGRNADTIFLSGMNNIAAVSAQIKPGQYTDTGAVWDSSVMTANYSVSNLSFNKYSQSRSSVIIPMLDSGGSHGSIPLGVRVPIEITLTPETPGARMGLAICGIGRAYELAHTEWGVETELLDFSKAARDDTFGTVEFIKRGSANRVQATCYIDPTGSDGVAGDVVHTMLRKFTGMPLMLDFNNISSSVIYDRLMIFGFYTNVRTIINADTFEVLTMDIEGLTS